MVRIQLGGREIELMVVRKRIKHTYIRVPYRDRLMVTTGKNISQKEILDLVRKHEKKLLGMPASIEAKPAYGTDEALFFGTVYPIERVSSPTNSVRFTDGCFFISGDRSDLQTIMLESFYRQETIIAASRLLENWEPRIGTDIGLSGITFTSQRMKTMLGNCNRIKRRIKLNSILARYDQKYLEAILIHELVHLNISGHQSDFYRLLTKYLPEYKKLRKELVGLVKRSEV